MGKGNRLRKLRTVPKEQQQFTSWENRCNGSKSYGIINQGVVGERTELFQENNGNGRFFLRIANLKEMVIKHNFVSKKRAMLLLYIMTTTKEKENDRN